MAANDAQVATRPVLSAQGEAEHSTALNGYEDVVKFLTAQLMNGSLRVGQRLLPERELAAQLNVSRPVVREALRSLSMIGVLDIRRGDGTFVKALDTGNFADLLAFALAQQGEIVDDILEVRIALERQAAGLACIRARAPDLDLLSKALDRIVETIDDPVAGGRADFHFHTMLVQASHSPAVIRIYAMVSDILMSSHISRRARISQTTESKTFLIDHHEQIFDAVRTHDVARCDALILRHFELGSELAASRMG